MAGAMGYALLEMACAVAMKKATGSDAERLTRISQQAKAGRDELLAAMTEDSGAYEGLRAARKKIKDQGLTGDAAKTVRAEATQAASEVPLRVARRCSAGLELARSVLKHTRPATRSDVGVALELLRSGAIGGAHNVLVNLDDSLSSREREKLRRGALGAVGGAEHHHSRLTRRVARSVGLSSG